VDQRAQCTLATLGLSRHRFILDRRQIAEQRENRRVERDLTTIDGGRFRDEDFFFLVLFEGVLDFLQDRRFPSADNASQNDQLTFLDRELQFQTACCDWAVSKYVDCPVRLISHVRAIVGETLTQEALLWMTLAEFARQARESTSPDSSIKPKILNSNQG
jgi:hypothetical protein